MDKHGAKERPIVVAMKGHPGTGKSTLANGLAKALKFPLIDKDHFRDSTLPIQRALEQAAVLTTEAVSKLLNDLSYDAMCRSAATQLGLGLSVVVDSPLSRRAHLDRLLEIASGGLVVVVECRAGDEAKWRRRIEARAAAGGGGWLHKPSTWVEMGRLLEGYGGCWDYDVGEVPRIVLDTTKVGVEVGDLVSKVIEFVHFSVGFRQEEL
ncbi:Unknown protein [Striga hermonthica]|uniref:Uncharacterized protein n=1 Tax=Striga hermonthica TaxID=68872 RepID=A0A9N7RAS1_STRHE|nr:Unknown protein [Striga hermonthica]